MQEGLRKTKEGVLHLGMGLSSESQFAAAATRSSISVMICPPLSLFVITAIPYPFNRCIARFARNPPVGSVMREIPSLSPFLDHKPDGKRPRPCRRGHFQCRAARKQL